MENTLFEEDLRELMEFRRIQKTRRLMTMIGCLLFFLPGIFITRFYYLELKPALKQPTLHQLKNDSKTDVETLTLKVFLTIKYCYKICHL